MPRLKERSDGCYYVVGFHHEGFTTWQIDREGVRFLAGKNVFAEGKQADSDGRFATEICFELWREGLIYTDGTKAKMEIRRQRRKSSPGRSNVIRLDKVRIEDPSQYIKR